jgi:hypothetical protein
MQPTRRAGFLAQGLVSPDLFSRAADWGRWAVRRKGEKSKRSQAEGF